VKLTIHSPDGLIRANTAISLGSFTQMTDFSATSFVMNNPDGTTEHLYAPPEVLQIIIQRNTMKFAADIGRYDSPELLDPLIHGPKKIIDHIIKEYGGKYHSVIFDLSNFMAGW
jgi:hypothetical protein